MLIALSGVTCVGKSYMMRKISSDFGIDKIRTIRTRKKREDEVEGRDGIFISEDELDNYIAAGKVAYCYNVFGGRYAYLKEDVYSERDIIFEMHYTMIDDFKRMRSDIKTIYIFPKKIEIPIAKVRERNISFEKKEERIKDIIAQYNKVKYDEEFRNKFDYVCYYDYDTNSEDEIEKIISEILGRSKQNE